MNADLRIMPSPSWAKNYSRGRNARAFRFVLTALSLLFGSVLIGWQRSDASRPTVSVQVLAFNDFHGYLEPVTGPNGLINTTVAGGAQYLATHLKNAIARNPNSIVVAAGNLIGGSPLVSALFHDEPAIESMNAMNLSVTSVGNHEFDDGWQELLRMEKGGCHPTDGCQDGDGFAGSRFQYLSANVIAFRAPKPGPLFPPVTVRTVGGVKIGFIGEVLRSTPQVVLPSNIRSLTFLDEATTANQYAERLRQQGVNAIVLLIHEGGRQRSDESTLDPNGCANFSGAIEDIARKLSPAIKVVISGHTHRFYNCTIAGHSVTSAGSFGRMFTRLELTLDPSKGTIVGVSATNEIVTRDVAPDPEQTAIIEKYKALAAPLSNRIIGSVTADIKRDINRSGESALGDVVADSQLASAASTTTGGAAVAFTNIGGVRADLVATAPAVTRAPRDVTYGELFAVQPFGNVITVMTMTGAAIARALEQQFDNPGAGQHTFLQVSRGFTYRYTLNAQGGQHVESGSIKLGGRVIAPTDRVRVAVNGFLVSGGDGFTAFERGTNRVGGGVDIHALVEYFQSHSPVSAGQLDRIVRTD